MTYRTDLGPRVYCKATFSSAEEAENWAHKTIVDIHHIAGTPIIGCINLNLNMERGRLAVFSMEPETRTKQVVVKLARDDTGYWTFSGLTASFWDKEDVLPSPDF